MSRLRLAVPGQPTAFIDLGPETPHRFSRAFDGIPVVVVGSMRPVMTHAKYLENRTRTKPPSPFSLHIENRR